MSRCWQSVPASTASTFRTAVCVWCSDLPFGQAHDHHDASEIPPTNDASITAEEDSCSLDFYPCCSSHDKYALHSESVDGDSHTSVVMLVHNMKACTSSHQTGPYLLTKSQQRQLESSSEHFHILPQKSQSIDDVVGPVISECS